MDFYYRRTNDGKCEVVCTRCFHTIGSASGTDQVWALEKSHLCTLQRPKPISVYAASPNRDKQPYTPPESLPQAIAVSSEFHPLRTALLLLAVAMLLYALPTILEFVALRRYSPWIAVVLPGDLLGCICLVLLFRKIKTGVVLYSLLTSIEACLFAFHIAPANTMAWMVDVIPTLVVCGNIWHSQMRGAQGVVYS